MTLGLALGKAGCNAIHSMVSNSVSDRLYAVPNAAPHTFARGFSNAMADVADSITHSWNIASI